MLDAYAAQLNETIIDIYDSVMQLEETMLRHSGQNVSITELHILETVWRLCSQGCSISDIAQEHHVTLPSMTIAIKKLEKKGLVKKTRSDSDGRVVYVVLTRMGEKINSMHRYFHEHMVRSFLRDVAAEQQPMLLAALQNMQVFLKNQLDSLEKRYSSAD